mmetsp:Transcript_26547/g.83014  ORF Transcript_26547/g.83014 Transcript_26547/m.83014 type:complete len:209 (-) Transcript_26547:472-1098(-)
MLAARRHDRWAVRSFRGSSNSRGGGARGDPQLLRVSRRRPGEGFCQLVFPPRRPPPQASRARGADACGEDEGRSPRSRASRPLSSGGPAAAGARFTRGSSPAPPPASGSAHLRPQGARRSALISAAAAAAALGVGLGGAALREQLQVLEDLEHLLAQVLLHVAHAVHEHLEELGELLEHRVLLDDALAHDLQHEVHPGRRLAAAQVLA